MASKFLIVPGLNGSGPSHWQSHWEKKLKNSVRVVQSDWEQPRLAPWRDTLISALDEHPGAILVAHSLGCALVANTVKANPSLNVSSALLVSPSDVDWASHIEDPLRDFAPMPLCQFPFRTNVVASRDDPYVEFERAQFFATEWGAELVDIGEKGHINSDSNLGAWPEGMSILERLTG